MARYIDADAMKDDIIKLRRTLDTDKCSNDFACGWVIGVDNMEGLIDRQPTSDVVEAVRCKDCKYWTTDNDGCCTNLSALVLVENENSNFCSYGERKEP